MWISKKKMQEKLRAERVEAFKFEQETEQWDKIRELEKQVKKLKKIVRKGY